MDELKMIRSLLDRPAPSGTVVEAGRDRLLAATHGEVPARAARPARRPLWLASGLGLAAVTAAVAVTVATPGGVGVRKAGPGSGAVPATLNARSVLLAAATVADGQPDATGAYWHSVTRSLSYARATGGYTVVFEDREQTWTPSAPHGYQWSRSQNVGARPATPADVTAWRRAGAPGTIKVVIPQKGAVPMSTRPGKVVTSRAALVGGDKVFWLGRNVSMKDLRALPADPQRLRSALLRWYGGHGTESSGEAMSSDLWLYSVTRGLVLDMPVTPKVRAAAFRMLARLRTVRAIGTVTDSEGRTGTAIALVEHTKGNGVLEHRLIVDARTGRALGEQLVVVTPSGATAGLRAGSVYTAETVVTQDWTASAPRSVSAGGR